MITHRKLVRIFTFTPLAYTKNSMKPHIDAIRANGTPRMYKAGSSIFFQGEFPRHGMLISKGTVRAYTIASSGEERTIGFFTRGDMLPIAWLLDQVAISLFHYQALDDVRVVQFSKTDFDGLILNDPLLLKSLFASLSRDYSASMFRINGLEQSRADEKIAFTLYFLVFRYGKPLQNGRYEITLRLRHAILASMVGLSRESTTKVLRNLQEKGIISYTGGIYIVDKDSLEHYVGEDVFKDLELV